MNAGPAELVGDDPLSLAQAGQAYPSSYALYMRRGSLKPPEFDTKLRGPVPRPGLQTRTLSAPSIHHRSRQSGHDTMLPTQVDRYDSDSAASVEDSGEDDQDDDDDEDYEDAPEMGRAPTNMSTYPTPPAYANEPHSRYDYLSSPTVSPSLVISHLLTSRLTQTRRMSDY